jgi:hypothetical protein
MRIANKKAMEWIVTQDMPIWYQYDGQLYIALAKNDFKIGEIAIEPLYSDQVKSSAPPFRYGLKCVSLAFKYKLGLK